MIYDLCRLLGRMLGFWHLPELWLHEMANQGVPTQPSPGTHESLALSFYTILERVCSSRSKEASSATCPCPGHSVASSLRTIVAMQANRAASHT